MQLIQLQQRSQPTEIVSVIEWWDSNNHNKGILKQGKEGKMQFTVVLGGFYILMKENV